MLSGGERRDTGFGRPARDLGDSVEARGAPGSDLGFAAFAAEAGLLLGWGFVDPCGGGRVHWVCGRGFWRSLRGDESRDLLPPLSRSRGRGHFREEVDSGYP